MSNLFKSKSDEEIKEVGKDLMDFATGHQPKKPTLAKDMTLRDYFAGQIISAMAAKRYENISGDLDDSIDSVINYSLLAYDAFQFANEMMYERDGSDE